MIYKGNGYLVDALCKDVTLSHENRYKYALWRDLKTIEVLSSVGHEIKWNVNDRWCTVNGKTFNVHKSVYEKNVIQSVLPDSFRAFTIDPSRRMMAVKYAFDSKGGDVLFDIALIDPSVDDLDTIFEEDDTETLVPQWVVNNLNNYGNCAVACPIPFFLSDLEELLDFDISVEQVADGMIIRRVYDN